MSTSPLSLIYFFPFISQAPYQTLSSVVHSPHWPSGHPGGGSHLSISRCCPGRLFWSNVLPGRNMRWRQMLLHKPVSSQCGFYNIKQTAFLSQCTVSLRRKPHCTGTRCDTAWAVGLALNVFVHEWVCGRRFHPSPTCPSAYLPPSLWNQSSFRQARPQHHGAI